jgi:hypothetical protein
LRRGAVSLSEHKSLVFWLAKQNENIPSWQNANPIVGFVDAAGRVTEFTPTSDVLNSPRDHEAREGWSYCAVPLSGDDEWTRSGDVVDSAVELRFGFDSWGGEPFVVWIDGLAFK